MLPAPRAVLPEAAHRSGKAKQEGIERDHQHLKGRYRPMRECKHLEPGQMVRASHGFIRNL